MEIREVSFSPDEIPATNPRIVVAGDKVTHIEVFSDLAENVRLVEHTVDMPNRFDDVRGFVTTAAKLLGVTISDDVIRAALDAGKN